MLLCFSVFSFIFPSSFFFLIQPDFFFLVLFSLSLATRFSPPTATHRQRPTPQQTHILLSSATSSTSAERSLLPSLLSCCWRIALPGSVGVQHPRVGSPVNADALWPRNLSANPERRLDFFRSDSFYRFAAILEKEGICRTSSRQSLLFFPTSIQERKKRKKPLGNTVNCRHRYRHHGSQWR